MRFFDKGMPGKSTLAMGQTYDERKVDKYEHPTEHWFVSTVAVDDGDHPFETAIAYHPRYTPDQMVIVEAYDDNCEAQLGHDKWVEIMTGDCLPDELVDCSNSHISQLCGDLTFPKLDA